MFRLLLLIAGLATGRGRGRRRNVVSRSWIHDHQSGKWNITSDEYLAMLDAELAMGFDVLTGTEVSPAHFRTLLEGWCAKHHLHLWHPHGVGASECMVISKEPIAKRRDRQLTSLRLRFGRTAPTYLISARIKRWGWVAVLHTPAHTDGLKDVGKSAWFTRVYLSILDHFHVAVMHRRRVVVTGDWNLDLRLARNEQKITHALGGLRWAGTDQQENTIDSRVIDGDFTNQPVREATKTGRARRGFDHKQIRTVYGRAI